jgi:hypothetical protein
MSNDKLKELVYILLSELELVLVKRMGVNFHVKIANRNSLCTTDFTLSFLEADKHFFMSFKLGLSGQEVANYIKDIMQVLEPQEFTVIEDCFYDKEEKIMKYGQEAIDAKQKMILQNQGYIKCPICEKVLKKENIHENGICKFCDLDVLVWH